MGYRRWGAWGLGLGCQALGRLWEADNVTLVGAWFGATAPLPIGDRPHLALPPVSALSTFGAAACRYLRNH